MKTPLNLLPLSSYLSTSYHVNEVLRALDELQAAFFKRKQPFLQTLEQDISFPLSDILKKLAIAHDINLEEVTDADMFLNALRDEIQKIPRLTLTLAQPPTLALIKEINRWILLNLKQAVTLDFTVDTTLIAGAKVNYNGHYKDFSVKKQMEHVTQTLMQA